MVGFRTAIEPNRRDGQLIQMTFAETISDNNPLLSPIANDLALTSGSATNLDSQLSSPSISALVPPQMSLGNFFSSLVASFKSFTSFPSAVLASVLQQVDNAIYQVQQLVSFCQNANSLLLAPVVQNAYSLWASLLGVKGQLTTRGSPSANTSTIQKVGVFSVQGTTTLPTLASLLGNSVTELLLLNPSAAGSPAIKIGSVIQYYQK